MLGSRIKFEYINFRNYEERRGRKMSMTMKMARVGAGLTQQQVADKMGIHAQTYSKMENDSDGVTIREAKLFSEIVGVPWTEIFFGVESNLIRENE